MAAEKNESLSIVIVDSGMGGLSICADIVEGLIQKKSHRLIRMTYFNAWPDRKFGYNRLPDDAERVHVFESALNTIDSMQPDLLLIACNTLSILYPSTYHAKSASYPTVGIIDYGVQMIYQEMLKLPDSRALILGTLTTVNSETHQKALIEKGIEAERIVGQPCDQLATRIESGPKAEEVSRMIDGFLGEAAKKLSSNGGQILAALCCTHFGYAQDLFEHWLNHHLGPNTRILNPNIAMSQDALNRFPENRVSDTRVDIDVVSRITWDEKKVGAIAATLVETSPQTAEGLRNYRADINLFTF